MAGLGLRLSSRSGLSVRGGGGASAPAIVLSATTIAEDAVSGSVVGALSVTNGSGSYTFSITADPDNKFAIDGSNLETAAALDYETATSHSVTIEADNGVDNPISRQFTINVTNVLEVTLSALTLDALTILEGSPEDTAVGAVQNKTSGSTLSLTGTAGGRFKLSGTNIVAGATATDYGTATSHEITLRETHSDGSNSPRDTVIEISVTEAGYSFANTEAENLIAAFSSEPSDAWKEAYDDFIGALKTASIWSAIDAMWIMRAPDSQSSKLEAKSAGASYTLSEVNSPTFTAKGGWAGNGTTSYLDTGFNLSTNRVNFAQNSGCLGVYIDGGADTASSNAIVIGATTTFIAPRGDSNTNRGRVNQATTSDAGASTTRQGLTTLNRSASNLVTGYRDGASTGTFTTASAAISSAAVYIGCRNNAGTPENFTNNRIGLAFISASLDATAQAALDTAWDAFVAATASL